jgi:hypothetical protein
VPQSGVLGQSGQGDPDRAVNELLPGGTGAGVVVDATAFDFGAVARRGGIVDGHGQAPAPEQRLDGEQGAAGQVAGPLTDGADGGVGGAEGVGDAGGAEPGSDGAAALGEEDADQQEGQAGGAAPVEPAGQS